MSAEAWRIVASAPGGPEVLTRESCPLPSPGEGEARIRNTAIGVNYIDTYHRSGLYPLPAPISIGSEAAGIVDAVGPGVTAVRPGQRVAYIPPHPGTYATHTLAEADRLFPLPDAIDDGLAAASLLKGLTAWMLIERCARVEAGQWVLVHAAAGGVGSIAVQWLKAIGARVIAHAGNAAKAAKAAGWGADCALSGSLDSLVAEVRARTGGRGVEVVLDGAGAATWDASLASVARRGLIVSFGNASGPVPPVAPLALSRAGSIFLTRPTLADYIDTAEARAIGATRLFSLLGAGIVKVEIGRRFALADAAEAHRALENRETTGSTILIP